MIGMESGEYCFAFLCKLYSLSVELMKILFIYRHFWPDTTPYASMLRTISAHLSENGHEVHVWTEMPTYRSVEFRVVDPKSCDVINGVHVHRVPRLPLWRKSKLVRQLDTIVFPFRMILKAMAARWFRGCDFDCVVTATVPPIVNGVCGRVTSKILNAKYIYHMQDIYPEVASTAGLMEKQSLLYSILLKFDKYTCLSADKVVVLSEDMRNTLKIRKISIDGVSVINNFLLESFDDQALSDCKDRIVEEQGDSDNEITAIFAGNLGRFQGLKNLVSAVNALERDGKFKLKFLGDGVMLKPLKELAKGNSQIVFRGRMPFEEAQREIKKADIGIVSLGKDVYRYAYPSKTLSYLGLGLPILLLVERESELSASLVDSGVAVCAGNTAIDSIGGAVRGLTQSPEKLKIMKENVPRVFTEDYSTEKVLAQWVSLMKQMEKIT